MISSVGLPLATSLFRKDNRAIVSSRRSPAQSAKVIPHIILDNKDRADAALLGADHRVQVCIEQIATPDSLSHKLTS